MVTWTHYDESPGADLEPLNWPRDDEGEIRLRIERARLRGEGQVHDYAPKTRWERWCEVESRLAPISYALIATGVAFLAFAWMWSR